MTPFLVPTSRAGRGAIKVNGELITGCIDVEVDNNNYFSADTFSCTFSVNRLPKSRDKAWFCAQQDMFIEVFLGYPPDPKNFTPADLQSWIYGQVDSIRYNPGPNTITCSGRDLTRVFIGNKTTQKWPNLTSSQIATKLAIARGLTPVVTATITKAGKFYEIDHVNMADDRSEWDILNYLADLEGFKVWVRGQSLYFAPPPDPTTTEPYQIVWNEASTKGPAKANFQNIGMERALTVSRGIQVIIRSWNKKQAHGFTASYPAKVKSIQVGKSSAGSGVQIFSRTIPNLTQEQALQRAQSWYQQLVSHELKIENLMLPGDNALDITSIIQMSGTGTVFDQLFYPDSIGRRLSMDGGYSMTVSAKNHATQSETGAL